MSDLVTPEKNKLVLIAGDDVTNLPVAERILQEAGFITSTCFDSKITAGFAQFYPDLILLVPLLPGNWELFLKVIRSLPERNAIPVIIAVRSQEKDLCAIALDDRIADIVKSPFEPEWLIFRVNHVLWLHQEMTYHREGSKRLADAQRIGNMGDWEWYPETGLFKSSEGISRILGLGHGQHSTTIERFLLAILAEDRALVEKGLQNALLNNCECSLECRIVSDREAPYVIRLQGCLENHAAAQKMRLVGTIQDLTSMRPVEDRLEMLKEAVDSLPIGITLSDINGRIIYVNPTEAKMHGYEVDELIGREAHHFAQKSLRKPLPPEKLNDIRVWKRESTNLKKNGEEFPVQLTSIAVKIDDRCLGIVTTCEDISKQKEAEKKIYQLAHLDFLTGLPNRRMFQDRLSQAIALARREKGKVCIAYLDLDNFKDINDTLGHDFGDKMLQDVASRLSATMRESDTLARLGGDEFVVILVSVKGQDNFTSAAQRLLSVFQHPFEIEGQKFYNSASIGIAIFPDDGDMGDQLLKCADTAMYQVKHEGKSGFRFYSAEMFEKITRRIAIKNALRNGLMNGEFFLLYQPQWNMTSFRIIGAEALIRWQSREFGLMLPADFITLIEDNGLIFEVGEWVLRSACIQARHWIAAGHSKMRFAVNISGKQLKQPNFIESVARVLCETGVDPGVMELEFTEGIIMEQAEKTIGILNELKRMGLQLSIDDFGTGYSSLSYLKNFPFDRIKIDRSFITDLSRDGGDVSIVQAIISISKALKMEVIAEGIETESQRQCLEELGCIEMQGYLLGMPMTAQELTNIMEKRGG